MEVSAGVLPAPNPTTSPLVPENAVLLILVQVSALDPDVVQSPESSALATAPVDVVTRTKPVARLPESSNPLVVACRSTMPEAAAVKVTEQVPADVSNRLRIIRY